MSFIDASILLPEWSLGLMLLIIALSITWIIMGWQDNKKWCPERKILVKARKTGASIIEIIDIGSNTAVWELAKKDRPDDIEFKSEYSGIRVDPILTSTGCEPKRMNGANIYSYAYESWLPQTTKNNLAFKTIIQYKNEKCKDMDFLTDIEFVALISTPQNHLEHDALMYLSKYFTTINKKEESTGKINTVHIRQFEKEVEDENTRALDNEGNPIPGSGNTFIQVVEEELEIPTFISRIEDIKGDIAKLPLVLGYYAGTEAFKNNANGYAAQDLEQLLNIHDKQSFMDFMKKFNIMLYAIAGAIVIGAAGVAVYIISLVHK